MTAVSIREGRVCIRNEGPVDSGQQHPDLAPMDKNRKEPEVSLRVMATFQGAECLYFSVSFVVTFMSLFQRKIEKEGGGEGRRNSLSMGSWQRMWEIPILILATFVLYVTMNAYFNFLICTIFVPPDFSYTNERRQCAMKKSILY